MERWVCRAGSVSDDGGVEVVWGSGGVESGLRGWRVVSEMKG